jgi:N-acetylglutamate synthase-like GNAT family acetyltransferase
VEINIINFEKKLEKNFFDLNIEWLNHFFKVEEFDYEVLSKSKYYIIDKGGEIFFAKFKNEIVGTVALMPTNENNIFELTKMAVKPEYRNKGIGKKLLQKCLSFSKQKGCKSLILYSNRKLKNAIYLYHQFGFEEVDMEQNSPYLRANIKMEKKIS